MLYFLIALGILIFVHELGHFLVAKRAGIRVERFSLGFPPRMIGFKWKETDYCLSWIPFGGYVKVAGMADVGAEESSGADWEFPSKPIWVRMAVIAAGPAMNLLFAYVAFLFLYSAYGVGSVDSTAIDPLEGSPAAIAGLRHGDVIVRVGERPVANYHELRRELETEAGAAVTVDAERDGRILAFDLPRETAADREGESSGMPYGLSLLYPTVVGGVVEGMPAESVGLKQGDRITSVAGTDVKNWDEMREQISRHPEEEIEIFWVRDGEQMAARITPEARPEGGGTIGQIGIGPHMSTADVSFREAASLSAASLINSAGLILDFIGNIFQEDRYKELGGPILIAKMADDTAERGLEHFIYFLSLLSVNLAILNLMPIPALDGGHLVFLTLEMVMRRPLSLRKREFCQQVGLVLIIGLMILVTFNDLNRLVLPYLTELFQ